MTKTPELIVLCGLPGAGKSTYAKQYVKTHPNTKVLSSDGIRNELYGDESIQGDPAEVFGLMKSRAVEYLNQGSDVIYDATGMMRMHRGEILACAPAFAVKKCVILWASIEECVKRDSKRNRKVGKEIIDMLVKTFEIPTCEEGFAEIQVIVPEGFDREAYEKHYVQTEKEIQGQPKAENILNWMHYGRKENLLPFSKNL